MDNEASSNNNEQTNYEYASFWRRAAAFAIDLFIVGIVIRILCLFKRDRIPKFSHRFNWLFDLSASLPALFELMAECAYCVYFWTNGGQTFGQLAMGIKVIKANGEPLTYTDSVIRYVGYLISGSILGFGYFWMLIDKDNQGILDKMAQTYVIRYKNETANKMTVAEEG